MVVSKVLVIGGTGYLGQHVAQASIRLGHPTFLLVRTTNPSEPAKAELLKSFTKEGATIITGDVSNHGSLVAALKQVDVVISVVRESIDQIKIIDAIKEVGTIKRFLPSEFGLEVDRVDGHPLRKLMKNLLGDKVKIRRAVEKAGIPYTYVVSGGFAGWYVAPIAQESGTTPRDGKLVIFGDGNAQGIYTEEADIGTFTVKCVDDPRAENKILHIRPKENFLSQNELTALWEKKIEHTFEKEFLDKEAVLKSINELPFPNSLVRAVMYTVFVKGDMTGFDLDPSKDVEASELYPDVKYITMDAYLSKLV